MKSFLTITLLTVLGSSAFAVGGDQYKTLFVCTPVESENPAAEEKLFLFEGGFTGGHTIRLTSLVEGESSVHNYFVKPKAQPQVGGPLVYTASSITFSINLTTTPAKDGSYIATVTIGDSSPESWSCLRPKLKQPIE